MNLKIHEAARLLGVDADEVSAWIRDRGLRAHRFQEQYRINSVELQEWALEHGVRVPPELMAVNRAAAGPSPDLVDALQRGGMHAQVRGRIGNSFASVPRNARGCGCFGSVSGASRYDRSWPRL